MDTSLEKASPFLLVLIVGLMAGVLLFDVLMPLGVAGSVPYVGVVMMGLWLRREKQVWVLAFLCALLVVAGFFLSPPPHAELWIVLVNRALALLAIAAGAMIVTRQRRAVNRLEQAFDGLAADNEMTKAELADTHLIMADQNTRMKGVLNSLSDAIVTIDPMGGIESFSQSAERMFGYNASEVYGENVSILMPEPYRSAHDGYLAAYRETGTPTIIGKYAHELEAVKKDGMVFPVELTVTELSLYSKKLYCGVIRDISERKESEKTLQQAQKMETIGQLTGGMAHDFNNLLTAVIGNLELCRDMTELTPEQKTLVELSLKAANRGADLTQRLLAFSRRQPLQPEVVNVNAAIGDAVELLHRMLGEHISIDTVYGGGVWPALVDISQLENSLINLAVNARDAMPNGGSLTIETSNARLDEDYAARHSELAPGQYVLIAVTDTGTGMSPEVQARVFEPFFTTKEVGHGTGLGLSMIFGFIKQSKGHVNIYSEENVGTTVKLYLPRAEGADQPRDNAGDATAAAAVGGDETILIVEDDPDVMGFVAAALRVIGYNVLEATDGVSALALVKDKKTPHIDLLLTDVVLPNGVNGRMVAEDIRKILPGIKVVFSSGYTENAIVHHGQVDEGVSFLAKPYTRQSLSTIIRRELDKPE